MGIGQSKTDASKSKDKVSVADLWIFVYCVRVESVFHWIRKTIPSCTCTVESRNNPPPPLHASIEQNGRSLFAGQWYLHVTTIGIKDHVHVHRIDTAHAQYTLQLSRIGVREIKNFLNYLNFIFNQLQVDSTNQPSSKEQELPQHTAPIKPSHKVRRLSITSHVVWNDIHLLTLSVGLTTWR